MPGRLLLLLALAASAGAQPRFQTELWTTEHGLPAHTVTGIDQTANGFLWIATTGGLARFDGTEFTVETGGASSGLPSPRLNGLVVDGNGVLWVAMEDGRVARREGRRFEVVEALDADSPQDVAAGRGGRIYVREGERLLTASGPDSSRPIAGRFATDGAGTVWVRCDGDRLCQVVADRLQPVGEAGVRHVVPTGEGIAVMRSAGDRWIVSGPSGQPLGEYPALGIPWRIDRHGRLWATDGITMHVSAPGMPSQAITLPTALVVDVFEDREGVVWVATGDAGVVAIREVPFTVFSESHGLPAGPVVTVTEASGRPIVSAGDGRLYEIVGGRAQRVDTPRGQWFGIAEGPDGTRWFAGYQLTGIAPDGSQRVLDEEVFQVLPLDGGLWVRTREATLWVVDDGTRLNVRRRIRTEASHALVREPDGIVWVATNGGLVRIGPDSAQTFTSEQGLPVDIVRAVHRTDDGALWIGTYGGGLARLLDGRVDVLDVSRGLAEDVVSSLFEDASGMLWMGGNQSIHRVRRSDVEAVFAGRGDQVHGVGYGRADGLPNPEGSGWPALRASDGTFWFPTFEGVARLDPMRARALEQTGPLVYVESIETGGGQKTWVSGEAVALSPGDRRFVVTFGGVGTRAPDRVTYQYALDGFDETWLDPTTDREATFTNVSPGEYTFRVRARIADGEWSAPAAVALTVPPYWWETGWARLLGVLALGVAGLLAVRQRDRTLRERAHRLDRLVTERTAALEAEKETVAEQAAQLLTLDEAKSRLFANVSHEFRTPLQLILGPLADVAEGRHGEVPEAVRQQVQLASRNGRRLLALVEQLLTLARSDAGELDAEIASLDAAAFATRVAEAFEPLAEREGIHFDTDLPDAQGTFDPVLVESALVNLLANALSHTPAGGRVVFTLTPGDFRTPLRFQVSDTGPGLAPEHAARVFDRFYQAPDASSRRGSGIGLSLVREVARLHSGDATVESVPGQGSTFTLSLPRQRDAGRPWTEPDLRTAALLSVSGDGAGDGGAGRATPEPPLAHADVPLVLVVDDNDDLRALVRQHLDADYAVAEAASGHEALAFVRGRVPDAIVSDVMMPGLDGLGLLRELRADPETDFIPVLLLTARASVPDTVEGLGAGADDYLAKPFASAELRARVGALLRERRRLRERWQGPSPASLPVQLAPAADATHRALVRQLVEVIDDRLDDETLAVEALAKAASMSRATLYRRLDAATDGTPADLIREVRLARAAEMLTARAGTVSEVAYASGFKSVSHFAARFKSRYGVSPSAYSVTVERG